MSDRIVVDPNILGGKPVIKGTRIPVYLIIKLLASGYGENKILESYPSLKKEDIKAALEYAENILESEEIKKFKSVV
jgi:uncharacterized protein (DUF433 family)